MRDIDEDDDLFRLGRSFYYDAFDEAGVKIEHGMSQFYAFWVDSTEFQIARVASAQLVSVLKLFNCYSDWKKSDGIYRKSGKLAGVGRHQTLRVIGMDHTLAVPSTWQDMAKARVNLTVTDPGWVACIVDWVASKRLLN